jgi:hypothetical protein
MISCGNTLPSTGPALRYRWIWILLLRDMFGSAPPSNKQDIILPDGRCDHLINLAFCKNSSFYHEKSPFRKPNNTPTPLDEGTLIKKGNTTEITYNAADRPRIKSEISSVLGRRDRQEANRALLRRS